MLTLTEHLPAYLLSSENSEAIAAQHTLPLTAEERQRSRHRFTTTDGIEIRLDLPRGTVLKHGDLLRSNLDPKILVEVIAKPEPVLTVTAHHQLDLLRAAYHLGNRHVPLEITTNYLRLSPDSVLADMLRQLHLHITEEVVPFQPEAGAYAGSHKHEH